MSHPHPTPTDTTLRNALHGLAADIAHHHTPPPAATVWLRSQRRARQRASARATLPLRIMSLIGLLAAAAAAAFVLHQSPANLTATSTNTNLLLDWAAPALALILAASWLLLHLDRSNNNQPTT